MATDVNKSARKRKSDIYFDLEVSEADFSPINSPVPEVLEAKNNISNETKIIQTSTDKEINNEISVDKIEINSVMLETGVLQRSTEICTETEKIICFGTKLEETEYCTNTKKVEQDTNNSELVVTQAESTKICRESEKVEPQLINFTKQSKETEICTKTQENVNCFVDKTETFKNLDKNLCEKTQNFSANVVVAQPKLTEVSTGTEKIKQETINLVTKTDDLTCMDMEVEETAADKRKPFVSLLFYDNRFADLFKSQIINHIKHLVNFELTEDLECDSVKTKVTLWENEIVHEPEPPSDLFVVDTTPSKSRDHIFLPKYSSNNCLIDEANSSSPKSGNILQCRPQSCFNCEGNHSMRDCTEIRDHKRIQINKSKFMASSNQIKTVRYHLDDDQKYKHLSPGKISDKLRRALDLRKQELPPYIYKMRRFGYPPGWLKEALISNEKLELFDIHGCAILGDGGDGDTLSVIDPSKVVDYPGFNVPMEKDYKDDFKYHRCPPYCDDYSKEMMIQYIQNTAKIEMENKKNNYMSVASVKYEESDSNSRGSENTEQVPRSNSPTLTDLELRKKQLLAELEKSLCSPQCNSLNSPHCTSETTDKSSQEVTPDIIESPSVVSSSFGTPILKTASPFSNLPNPDKFSKDISQVINFENLPDYTGKYEQMVKVINKVREFKNPENTTVDANKT